MHVSIVALPMSDNDPSQGEDLSARLDNLKARLDKSPARDSQKNDKPASGDRAGIAQAMKLSSEFIAGVVVGALIGYAFDRFFGTSPWGLIFFLMIGFAAAVLNVMRAAGVVAESGMRLHKVREQADRDTDGGES